MKYIIDIPDEYENDYISMSPLLGKVFCYPIRNMNKTYVIPTGLKIEQYTETDRSVIEDEVWEFAKKVRLEEFIDEEGRLHGYISGFNSYSEAKAKYEEWLKRKAEIRVGDEVKQKTVLWTGVVVGFDEVGDLIIMDRSGKSCYGYKAKSFKKTGRHFDEVEELLKKMGDEK